MMRFVLVGLLSWGVVGCDGDDGPEEETDCSLPLEGRWAGRLQCGSEGAGFDVDVTLQALDDWTLQSTQGELGLEFDAGGTTTLLDVTFVLDVELRDCTGQQELEVDMACLTYLHELIEEDGTVTTPRDECLPTDFQDVAVSWNGADELVMSVDGCEGPLQPVGD